MTVVDRNGRPNRPWKTRGVRTVVVALLAIGGGVGCGQPALRTPAGPGLAAESLGQAVEPTPSQKLFWDHPAGRQANAGAAGRGASNPPIAIDPGRAERANEKLNAGITPAGFVAGFDGSTAARTTWNGWKIPETRATAPAPAVASAEAPAAEPTGNAGAESSPPPTALGEEIPPPARRSTAGETVAVSGTALDALVAACRSTKIAPPMLAPPAPRVAAAVRAPLDPPSPEPAKPVDPPGAVSAEPRVVAGDAAPTPTAPAPKAEANPPQAVVVDETPAPVGSPEAGTELPSLAEQETAVKKDVPAVNLPETVTPAAEPAAVVAAPASTTRSMPAPALDPLQAACQATSIEPPRLPPVATEMPVVPSAVEDGPLPPATNDVENPPTDIPMPATAPRRVPALLPPPVPPVGPASEGRGDAGDALSAASRATSIPMPVRPAPRADSLLEASRATSIPLPSPPRGDR